MGDTRTSTRVMPSYDSELQIVRCQCHLRVPCGEMVKCTRCGCLSHKKCVVPEDPFVCTFCHRASQRLMIDSFNKSSTPSGMIIDRSALNSHIINQKNPIEVCEIREHTLASGHVIELIRKLISYLNSIDLSIRIMEQHLQEPIYDAVREQLVEALHVQKDLHYRHSQILFQALEKFETGIKAQRVLPTFRDAIIEELL